MKRWTSSSSKFQGSTILTKPRAGYLLGFVVLLASLGLARVHIDLRDVPNVIVPDRVSVGEAFSQRGVLTVCVPKTSQHRPNYDYPWEVLLNAFKSDFPDFNLDFQILETNELGLRLNSSQQDPHFPDVAFVDYDRDLRPLIDDKAVVMMWGRPRFDREFIGSWVIFRQAKNFEAGKAFMLWLAQSPQWKPMQVSTTSIGPEDIAKVQTISKKAVLAIAYGSRHSLWSIMDPAAGHFDDVGWYGTFTPQGVQPLLTFGNSRLAFVLMAEAGQRETEPGVPQSFGMAHSAVILRKLGDDWKVLSILPDDSLPHLESLLGAFDHLGLDEGSPEPVPKVTLLAPADHAQLLNHPLPHLEWTQVKPTPAAYVWEIQITSGGIERWSPSWIKVISPVPDESSLRMTMPIGNPPPCRCRVWAISKSGIVSTSDWRVIDFKN
jgi:hypothetical protein